MYANTLAKTEIVQVSVGIQFRETLCTPTIIVDGETKVSAHGFHTGGVHSAFTVGVVEYVLIEVGQPAHF